MPQGNIGNYKPEDVTALIDAIDAAVMKSEYRKATDAAAGFLQGHAPLIKEAPALLDALAEYVEYLEAYLEYADDDDPAHEIINRRKEQLSKLRPLILTPRKR